MVTLDELEAFDLTTWFGSRQLAAEVKHCHPSGIGRRCQVVVERFDLALLGRSRYCSMSVEGHELLQLQRRVHQDFRFHFRSGLRLEAAPDVSSALPPGWWMPVVRQGKKPLSRKKICELVHDSIVDAALCAGELIVLPAKADHEAVQMLRQRLFALTRRDCVIG